MEGGQYIFPGYRADARSEIAISEELAIGIVLDNENGIDNGNSYCTATRTRFQLSPSVKSLPHPVPFQAVDELLFRYRTSVATFACLMGGNRLIYKLL